MKYMTKIYLLCYANVLVCLKYNFSDTVNSNLLQLKLEYFKDIFRLKSEKKEYKGLTKVMVLL